MSRLLINSAVFILGILLAFVFALRGRLVSFAYTIAPTKEVPIEKLEMPSTMQVSEARMAYARQRRSLLKKEISLEQRLGIIEKALEIGSDESLQLLGEEHLRTLPDYRATILPRIKYLALEVLFSHFSDADWRAWPVGALSPEGAATAARTYVDRVWAVNTDIGSFLETAAHLLHGMYVSISAGTPYPLHEDLQYLVLNAGDVLAERTDAPEILESAFDPSILKDPVVELSFEKIRGQLTERFIEEHPKAIEANLALLLDLDHRVVDEPLKQELVELLRALSLNASSKYRAEMLPTIVDSDLLDELVRHEPALARALAQLYAISAVDAIDAGRVPLATQLLARSESSHPGLKAQELLRLYLRRLEPLEAEEAQPQATAMPVLEPVAPKAAAKPVPPVERVQPESSLGFFSILSLIALFSGAVYLTILVRNQRRSDGSARSSEEPSFIDPEPEPQGSVLTDPSAIAFEVDEEPEEIDFGFGDLANG